MTAIPATSTGMRRCRGEVHRSYLVEAQCRGAQRAAALAGTEPAHLACTPLLSLAAPSLVSSLESLVSGRERFVHLRTVMAT